MATPGAPSLSDQLCFDLYAASRAVTGAYRPQLAALGLTYPQYLVLLVLWEEESATVRSLSQRLRLDYGTLTPLLRRMEAAGLITRQRVVGDERFVEVGLSQHGSELSAHAERLRCEMVALLDLDEEQITSLQATLRVLTQNAAGA